MSVRGEQAESGELDTGCAPPYRAPVDDRAVLPPTLRMSTQCSRSDGRVAFALDPDAANRQPDTDPSSAASETNTPVVADYEILAEVGRGGMGVVYQARQRSLNRLIALKMVLGGLHADTAARMRFRTEAEAIARLQHPNIVQIYDVSRPGEQPFLAMEYVDGGNLQQAVAGRAQPERAAAQLVETLAHAVDYMHQRGILHRDLKPTNILLASVVRAAGSEVNGSESLCVATNEGPRTTDVWPKITDFGLAKILDAEVGPTRTEAFLGTPNYMAPEQALGDIRNVGPPADVYSLGAILYELVTGCPPFTGTRAFEILEQVRSTDVRPPRHWRPSLSADLETICLKCLEKKPDRRYASAAALADDLRRFVEGRPIRARRVSLWERGLRAARRRPAACAAAGVALAAVICLLLTGWWYAADAVQRHQRQAEQRYQRFIERRNDAMLHGLLAPEQGALFLGTEAPANLARSEAAAREALDLAGVEITAGAKPTAVAMPAARQAEVVSDSYALLLLLASVRAHTEPRPSGSGESQPPLPDGRTSDHTARAHEALALLDRARDLGIQTRAYHERRARIFERLGEPQKALAEVALAAALPAAGALDHFLLGEVHYRRGEWQQAMRSFDQALQAPAGHFWAQFFLAVCHLKLQHWESARVGLTACLTQQPDFVWAHLFRSFANERLRRTGDAEADFDRALQLDPGAEARYVLYITRGILRFHQGALDQAAADFRSAIALKPEQYNGYLNLAHVHLAEGRLEQAAEQERLGLRLRPPDRVIANYYVEQGRQLVRDGKPEAAVTACDAALQRAPDEPFPHEVRGRALLALGRPAEAEAAFDAYLRAGGAATTDVFRGRGQARMRLGKFAEAGDDYTRALERGPDGDVFQHRGWAYFFSDAWKLALRDFAKAIELNPQGADAYVGRGLANVMLGAYREAVADADAALARQPSAPEMMHNIACVFAQAALRADADAAREDALALAPMYRSRAVAAIRRTLAMLPGDQRQRFLDEKILPDAALNPIRNDREFRKLLQEYDRKPAE
jgi:serine/threonine protein kinase/Tfp pilus assembly protein PilF